MYLNSHNKMFQRKESLKSTLTQGNTLIYDNTSLNNLKDFYTILKLGRHEFCVMLFQLIKGISDFNVAEIL